MSQDRTDPAPTVTPAPAISVVVPVYDEAENVGALADEIAAAFADQPFEMVFVDDCSKDRTREVLVAARLRHPMLRVLSHRTNAGQSRAVRSGVLAARGAIILTLDGDGQNDPADGPRLVEQLTRPGADPALGMVGGRRVKRQDSAWKRFGSRFGNGVRKALLKDQADDTGCGLKAFRREAFLLLPYFDHMHRFLPALMLREGYRIEFADVNHRHRRHGVSKYNNLGRLKASVADLWGVMWLRSRARLPGGADEV